MENNGGFEKENVIGPIYNCSPVLPSPSVETLKRIISAPLSRSVLKDSQKDNTLDSPEIEEFSKVSRFMSTPLQHSADCKPPRNSWDEIRKLDEEELWIERTQVVTKEDHILYFEIAKEVVNSIIENLPVKSMENDNVESAVAGLAENDADEAINQAVLVFDEKKEEDVSDDQNVNGEDTLSSQLFDEPSERTILEDNDFIQACSDLDTTVKEILADEESSGEQLEDTQIDDLNSDAEKTICNDSTTELSDTIGDNDDFELQIDEDSFKPANEGAFALELDYLETIGLNSDDAEYMSELSRQSLYVKFDPLVQARKSEKSKEESSVLASVNPADLLFSGPISASDLLVMDTPPKKQGQSLGFDSDLLVMDSPLKNPSQSLSALANGGLELSEVASTTTPVDQLFNYSPSKECITTEKLETDDRTESNSTVPEGDSALVQPLLYSKSDLDKAVAAAVEKLKTQWGEENAFHELEIKEHTTKIEKLVAEKNKALAEIHEIKTVMLEYEQTMAQMIEDREKNKSQHEKSNSEKDQERNQLKNDLTNTEKSFAHLHKKFEKLKTAVEAYQKNEEILKKTVHDLQQHLKTSEGKYKLLKQHAESKINDANVEITKVKTNNKGEVAALQAALQAGLKREKATVSSLQQNLDQKIIENKELAAICDELINKVGSTAQ